MSRSGCFVTGYGRYCLEDIRTGIKSIGDNSVDMIITDPPWGVRKNDPYDDSEVFFEVLGELYRVLKPSGIFAVYYAVKKLDILFREVSKYFKYYWMIVRINIHSTTRCPFGYSEYTPLVLFYKDRRPKAKYKVGDVYISSDMALNVLKYTDKEIIKQFKATHLTSIVIQLFTDQNSLILDPFAGYGSIPYVAEHFKRKWIAYDIDPEKYRIAQKILKNMDENIAML